MIFQFVAYTLQNFIRRLHFKPERLLSYTVFELLVDTKFVVFLDVLTRIIRKRCEKKKLPSFRFFFVPDEISVTVG